MSIQAGKGLMRWLAPFAIVVGILAHGTAQGDPLSGAALVTELRQGGYLLVMRHASSPAAPPTTATAEQDNTKLERQLDAAGRDSAQAMGKAIKALGIPIGKVWSSPTYRAMETVRLAGLPNPTTEAELGDGGQSMQATSKDQTAWLRAKVAERPPAGSNTIIVTQFPNIIAVFGQSASGLADGEALVIHLEGADTNEIVGRMKIEEWPALAAQHGTQN